MSAVMYGRRDFLKGSVAACATAMLRRHALGQQPGTDRVTKLSPKGPCVMVDGVPLYANAERQPWRSEQDVIRGSDWSLPDWVGLPTQGYMMTGMGPHDGSFPGNRMASVLVTWAELEPKEGQYDFDLLRKRMASKLNGDSKGVELHVHASVWETRYFEIGQDRGANTPYHEETGSAPRWLAQYNIPLKEEIARWETDRPFQIVNMDIFNPAYHSRYIRFIEQMGQSGVLHDERLRIAYIHMLSATRGEEGGANWKQGDPEFPLVKERLDTWAKAAGPNVSRLASTAHSGPLLDYAYSLGMGQRNGFIEMYLLHVENRQLGQHLDPDGYLITDESFPPIAEDRAWGDENEEYSPAWVRRYGPLNTFPHRYREASLRALQMRRNSLWEQAGDHTLDPYLTAYVGLSLGRTIHDTPDAWCELRESYIHDGERPNGRVVPVKNFERWLIQRDHPGYETTPTRRVDYGWTSKSAVFATTSRTYVVDRLFDMTARKGHRIGFQVDERFLASTHGNVAIKVSYFDNCSWKLRAGTSHGPMEYLVKNGSTDNLLTITFFLQGLLPHSVGDGPFDFVLEGLDGAVEASFVRVVRTNPQPNTKT